MRKAKLMLVILLLAVIGGFGFYSLRSGWLDDLWDHDSAPIAKAPDTPGSLPAGHTDEGRPSFDIVRAEPDGSIIMAGQAKPGWTVIVESDNNEIGRATADDNGEWIIEATTRLAKGEHSLELSAQSPEGETTLFSKQRLALSLADLTAGQPLVALTEEGKATRVLQMPPPQTAASIGSWQDTEPKKQISSGLETAALTQPKPKIEEPVQIPRQLSFASVDYEDASEKSMIFMTGRADPGSRIALFIDNEHLGTVTADATGNWTFSSNKELKGRRHALKADLFADQGDTVVLSAEVDFERAPPTTITAFADDDKAKSDALNTTPTASDAVSESAERMALANGSPLEPEILKGDEKESGVVIVKRGDTLWHIARRHYGDGKKYTQIFKNNKGQIRNPNWIYPDQRFSLP